MSSPSPVFRIGSVTIHGDAILAPMDGFSDWPYRSICRHFGSAMNVTEFVRAEVVLHSFKQAAPRLTFQPQERPIAFQIYGNNVHEIVEAARRLQEYAPDMIDINMGCPARRVVHGGAGAWWMRAPLKVARLFRKLSAALEVPVTAKIRLGWDDCRNYRLIARIIAENGAAAITIHARTREQGYSGEADWDAIGEVCHLVHIPVIGNGGIRNVADIARMKTQTGCQAVMIGQAAIGNPWIFAGRERDDILPDEIYQVMRAHLRLNLGFYGVERGYILFRKHAHRYLSLAGMSPEQRTEIITQENADAFLDVLEQRFAEQQSLPPRLN